MKQINLVPITVRQRSVARRTVPYLALALILGLATAGLAWAALGIQVSSLQHEQDALILDEQARQQKQTAELASLQVDVDLKTRVQQLNILAGKDINWHRAFSYVAGVTPKDIVMSSYSLATSSNGTTLKLVGSAPSNVSYATFVEYLKQSVGTVVTSYKVDGYTYDPKSGSVTFAISITVPTSKLSFTAS